MAESDEHLRFLQKVDLTGNKITVLPQVTSASLYKLVLDENEISLCGMKTHNGIRILSLNKNKMTTCIGFSSMFNLEELSLQENEIATLNGLEILPKLKKLNLNGNKLERLEGFPKLESIVELSLEGN